MPWDTGTPTAAEQRVDDLLGQGRGRIRRPEVIEPAEPLDVHAEKFAPEREVRGEYLTRRLVEPEETSWRAVWRRSGQQPVIRIEDALITGVLNLRATELPYLLEFVRCRFEHAPDFRQLSLAGLVLSECRFPGIYARNLAVTNDTVFSRCTMIGGGIDLADAQLGGSLILNDSELRRPRRRVLYADRLSVAGALLAMNMTSVGELRIPGIKVGGNLTFCGSALRNRGYLAVNATGIQVGGSLRCDPERDGAAPFTMAGLFFMPSARVHGDLRFRDAILEPGVAPPRRGESAHDDPHAALIINRAEVRGDMQLDQGFRSGGTIRMVSSRIGGDLRMSGALIDLSWSRSPSDSVRDPLRALHFDGTEIAGNLEAAGITAHGQLRFADANVRGSFQLNRAVLVGPRTDMLQANRIRIGSNMECREAEVSGSLQFQGAQFGANVDLRAANLVKPAWHKYRQDYKPSLDLRAARIGRDLICAEGGQVLFRSEGEVQLRRAVVERHVNFIRCVLGEADYGNAISAFGLVAQELTLLPVEPPRGRIQLQQAQCELLTDNAELWSARGGIDVEDFSYDNLRETADPINQGPVRRRLRWLRAASDGQYQPGSYDQLASVYRDSGNEELAVIVLIEKQRHRYRAIARGSSPTFRPLVRLWSLLQLATVSYGYRPLRALLWLLLFGVAGTTWFSHHQLVPINEEDHPVWNPLLYTVDQLVPIINLGHDVMWQAKGHSQWITVTLIAAGWILATTVAAGITRGLRRER